MSWLSDKIAQLGQNAQFVAFFAHAGVAALLVEHLPGHAWWWLTGMLVYAAGKEFWFDATYEKNPPQTFWDNLEDFIGYAIGAVLGYFLRVGV